MLETIKHLFDIKNLVFIISTDTAQLEHSIKAVYGNGFDSFEYLHRFFKQRITLPKPDYYKFLCMEKAFESIDFSSHHFYPNIDSADKIRALVALQAETNGVELRKLVNIYSQMDAILSNINLEQKNAIDLVYLTVISFTFNINTNTGDPYLSIRTPRAEIKNKITVNSVCVCESAQQEPAIKYNELAKDIIEEFHNLNKINDENFHQKTWRIKLLTEGAASALFSDLQHNYFHDYVSRLIHELKDGDTKLLTQDELKKMIITLKIQDAFSN